MLHNILYQQGNEIYYKSLTTTTRNTVTNAYCGISTFECKITAQNINSRDHLLPLKGVKGVASIPLIKEEVITVIKVEDDCPIHFF